MPLAGKPVGGLNIPLFVLALPTASVKPFSIRLSCLCLRQTKAVYSRKLSGFDDQGRQKKFWIKPFTFRKIKIYDYVS
jgi:hypothetical protein